MYITGCKAHLTERASVNPTETGTPAKRGTVLVEEAFPGFPSTLRNEALSTEQVLRTAMQCICRMYDVDFCDLEDQHDNVAVNSILSFVDFVIARPPDNWLLKEEDGMTNTPHDSLPEADMVELGIMCVGIMRGVHTTHFCSTLQFGD